jgi:hypothetical protein
MPFNATIVSIMAQSRMFRPSSIFLTVMLTVMPLIEPTLKERAKIEGPCSQNFIFFETYEWAQ